MLNGKTKDLNVNHRRILKNWRGGGPVHYIKHVHVTYIRFCWRREDIWTLGYRRCRRDALEFISREILLNVNIHWP